MMDKQDIKNLKKRYLIWLYKTTKEALDKIERKFTQLEIDKFILRELNKLNKSGKVRQFIADFSAYVQNKEKQSLDLKYVGKELKADYYFLVLKLKAVEKAIIKEFDKGTLKQIKSLYEKEMTERILTSTEQK